MGLTYFEIKKYTDHEKKPIIYSGPENIFSIKSNKQSVQFQLTQVSDVEFVGKALVNGFPVIRTLKYNKAQSFFESSTEFQVGVPELSFVLADHKHKPKSSNFLMPSFEKQDFLYREGDKIKTEMISSIKESEAFNKSASQISLASINTQYFSQALIDKSEISPHINMIVQGAAALMNVEYDLKNTQIGKISQLYFIGPKSNETLQQIDALLPEVMDYGIFGFISRPLLLLMRFMHRMLGNWGLAIIALTIVVRLVMLPFNILSFKSSRAMQKIQPLLQATREKYKNDPMRVNKETMALMKEHKANPLSGCLPMLIQIPIFFALWRTIGSSIDIYQQPFFGWITDLSAHDHFFVLPILMGITMFFQQKLTPSTMDPTQQKILNFMPILFALFMLSLPSGLTLYNFVSALFGVVQQYFLLKDNSVKKTA
jgi:YidC/Oxa1 family membrane protein insertase